MFFFVTGLTLPIRWTFISMSAPTMALCSSQSAVGARALDLENAN